MKAARNRKCPLCGYELRRTCVGRTCRYDRKTGKVNVGPACHTDCATRHYLAHWHWRSALASARGQEGGGA